MAICPCGTQTTRRHISRCSIAHSLVLKPPNQRRQTFATLSANPRLSNRRKKAILADMEKEGDAALVPVPALPAPHRRPRANRPIAGGQRAPLPRLRQQAPSPPNKGVLANNHRRTGPTRPKAAPPPKPNTAPRRKLDPEPAEGPAIPNEGFGAETWGGLPSLSAAPAHRRSWSISTEESQPEYQWVPLTTLFSSKKEDGTA
ncbi:hypothetical protein B0T25DRAFT_128700 [Lasiosphaeria hispida]|uniref:Uncharacterized protein n=1 Tax=Lasiosphaeria hispida TaxID=260671 RepID=A0AAJ0MIK1_9PEZI|nr:hypothetical protein B0T25DRAFT_128700 [Lasiosphaeria hispida]